MKYFICAMDKGSIGIPAERTERIIANTRIQNNVYETEAGTAYISLPLLLLQKDFPAPHGIVLKPAVPEAEVKTVLLAPRVDIEMEIPEEDIHCLPESLAGLNRFFSGAYFTEETIILILDTKKLTGNIV